MPSNSRETINRAYKVTQSDNGQILFLGNAHDGRVSTFVVHFVADATFAGSFAVLARSEARAANDDGAGFGGVPYKRVSLNGLAADRALVTDILTGPFIIEIPCSGLSAALLVQCQQGFGTLYSVPLSGPST